MGFGSKSRVPHAYFLPVASHLHGVCLQTPGSPCIFSSGRFSFAWGSALNRLFPMQFFLWQLLTCMGFVSKRLVPHAYFLPGASHLHGVWLQTPGFPCISSSGSFPLAWGLAPKATFPMQDSPRKLLTCNQSAFSGALPMASTPILSIALSGNHHKENPIPLLWPSESSF